MNNLAGRVLGAMIISLLLSGIVYVFKLITKGVTPTQNNEQKALDATTAPVYNLCYEKAQAACVAAFINPSYNQLFAVFGAFVLVLKLAKMPIDTQHAILYKVAKQMSKIAKPGDPVESSMMGAAFLHFFLIEHAYRLITSDVYEEPMDEELLTEFLANQIETLTQTTLDSDHMRFLEQHIINFVSLIGKNENFSFYLPENN